MPGVLSIASIAACTCGLDIVCRIPFISIPFTSGMPKAPPPPSPPSPPIPASAPKTTCTSTCKHSQPQVSFTIQHLAEGVLKDHAYLECQLQQHPPLAGWLVPKGLGSGAVLGAPLVGGAAAAAAGVAVAGAAGGLNRAAKGLSPGPEAGVALVAAFNSGSYAVAGRKLLTFLHRLARDTLVAKTLITQRCCQSQHQKLVPKAVFSWLCYLEIFIHPSQHVKPFRMRLDVAHCSVTCPHMLSQKGLETTSVHYYSLPVHGYG